jgi:hypothetical protein
MANEPVERWKQLCEEVKHEQDTDRMIALVREINRLLEEKHKKLSGTEDVPILFTKQPTETAE